MVSALTTSSIGAALTPSQQSRIEREPASHRRHPESEGFPLPTPPPLSRQSSQAEPMSWDYNDTRHERPERYSRRADDGPLSADRTKPERDRYPPIEEPRRSLEDRITLSPQESRTTHPLPLNPSLRRDVYSPEEPRQSTQSTSHGHPESFHGFQPSEGERRGSFRKDRDVAAHSDNLVDRVGGYDEGASGRPPRNARARRTDSSLDNNSPLPVDAQAGSSSHHRASEDVAEHGQRPSNLQRSASLLERMTVADGSGDGKAAGFDEAPSLRDRVQIPSKREWDDMGAVQSSPDAYGRESYLGEDESAAKRRRKNGKPKRGRRGAP
ncbi:hypothetical protein B0H12DRAFT_1116461 [Mycena haematopus]|nr:hypothetical protein B0H12DRAFT_1116461 [Mycena haematopus]